MFKRFTRNRWLRGWVLLTAIWSVVVVLYTAVGIRDTFDEPSPSALMHQLSLGAQTFFNTAIVDDNGTLVAQVPVTYSDGSTEVILFPYVKEIALFEFRNQLKDMTRRTGKTIPGLESQKAYFQYQASNTYRLESIKEYDSHLDDIRTRNMKERVKILMAGLLALVIPPSLLLLLGYAVVWVIKGSPEQT